MRTSILTQTASSTVPCPAQLVTSRTAGGRPCLEAALLAEVVFGLLAAHPATLAACVLPDHVHWLLAHPRLDRQATADAVQRFRTSSSDLAARLGLRGRLWRPGDAEIRTVIRVRQVGDWIVDNPRRLGLISQAPLWPWSIRRFDEEVQ